MGLSEEFFHSKDQVLLMDPLPSLSRVYSMILKVEKQCMTHMLNVDHMDVAALMMKS